MTEMLNQDSRPDSGQGLTREAWLHRAIETFRAQFDEIGPPLPGKLHVSVGFGYSSRAESKYILGQCWARRASADGVAAAPPASKAAPQTPRLAGRVCQAREGMRLTVPVAVTLPTGQVSFRSRFGGAGECTRPPLRSPGLAWLLREGRAAPDPEPSPDPVPAPAPGAAR
jgi:hypothetical protein